MAETMEFRGMRRRLKVSLQELAVEIGQDFREISAVERVSPTVPDEWTDAVRRIAERRLEPVAEPAEGAAA